MKNLFYLIAITILSLSLIAGCDDPAEDSKLVWEEIQTSHGDISIANNPSFKKGEKLFKEGKYDEALIELKKVHEVDKDLMYLRHLIQMSELKKKGR